MHAHDLIHDNVQLLSLPEICLRIQQLAGNPHAEMGEFAELVSQDPALTIRLLKLVNSAYYGFPGRVDTLTRAINLVGIAELRNLSLAMAAMEVFGGLENERFDMLSFWCHSVYVALLARFLAKRAGVLHGERLFIAGLLHDVGRLLIFSLLPEGAAMILQRIVRGEDVCTAERAELGFDHAEVGYELLTLWRLPTALCSAVAYHHCNEPPQDAPLETSLVHIANHIAHQVESIAQNRSAAKYDPFGDYTNPQVLADLPERALIDNIAPAMWAAAGLTPEVVDAAVAAAAVDFDEILNILYRV